MGALFGIIALIIAFIIIEKRNDEYRKQAKERRNTHKGEVGEWKVKGILEPLNSSHYQVINDVLIKTSFGTTQIDHIVVSVYGIFVIETKNYNGILKGHENSKNLTYIINKQSYSCYNPLLQNKGHIKALQRLLRVKNSCFIPVLAVSNSCTIEIDTDKDVVHFAQLYSTIRGYKKKVFTVAQVEKMAKKIRKANIVNPKARAQHIKRVQQYKNSR